MSQKITWLPHGSRSRNEDFYGLDCLCLCHLNQFLINQFTNPGLVVAPNLFLKIEPTISCNFLRCPVAPACFRREWSRDGTALSKFPWRGTFGIF